MQVNGKVFYHIHQKNEHSQKWEVGKKVKTDENDNYFRRLRYADLYRINDQIKQEAPYLETVLKELEDAKSFLRTVHFIGGVDWEDSYMKKVSDLVRLNVNLHDCLVVYIRFLTEILFEVERSSGFKHLPSRRNCIWLTSRRGIKRWLKILTVFNPQKLSEIKVFEVKAYGNTHKADGTWMTPDIYTIGEIFERARKYWSGELNIMKREQLIEYLFYGELHIVGQVDAERFV